jgi:DNA-binding MarR family transcriptional regulator
LETVLRSINHIARHAKIYREKALKPYGLGANHHSYVLAICRNPGISQEELAKEIFVNKSTVTRQLTILEKKGFVTRKHHATDARKLLVFPTERSLHVYPIIIDILEDWNKQLLAELSPTERRALLAQLTLVEKQSVTMLKQSAEQH